MIRVEQLFIRVGNFALEDFSLEVPKGCYAVLMGRTGSGKTTLLEVLTGLKQIESGRVLLGGVDVTGRRPAERGIGYVPQDGALFSTMTVRDHLGFALWVRRTKADVRKRRIDELAELLGIESLLDRKPAGLSGGERQRVALGRALSFHPSVLLLDEPLSALDDHTRQQMYDVLRRVCAHAHVTTLHVTHNREDAAQLADKLYILRNGRAEVQPGPSLVNPSTERRFEAAQE